MAAPMEGENPTAERRLGGGVENEGDLLERDGSFRLQWGRKREF